MLSVPYALLALQAASAYAQFLNTFPSNLWASRIHQVWKSSANSPFITAEDALITFEVSDGTTPGFSTNCTLDTLNQDRGILHPCDNPTYQFAIQTLGNVPSTIVFKGWTMNLNITHTVDFSKSRSVRSLGVSLLSTNWILNGSGVDCNVLALPAILTTPAPSGWQGDPSNI